MHSHECRYCGKYFICGDSALTCFKSQIACAGCFWTNDFINAIFAMTTVTLGAAAVIQILAEMLKRFVD